MMLITDKGSVFQEKQWSEWAGTVFFVHTKVIIEGITCIDKIKKKNHSYVP